MAIPYPMPYVDHDPPQPRKSREQIMAEAYELGIRPIIQPTGMKVKEG